MRRTLAVLASLAIAASVLVVASPAAADSIRDRQYWLNQYGISSAWDTTKGAGVTGAVIDPGIDGTHPDLTGQVVAGTDVSGVAGQGRHTPVGSSGGQG